LASGVRAKRSPAKDFREVGLKLVLIYSSHDCVLQVIHLGMLCDFYDDLLGSQEIETGIDFTVSTVTAVKLDNFKAFLKDNTD
jgi:hypothetical protein